MDPTARNYQYFHETRYRKYFQEGGKYFLDAGCGGLPRSDFSSNFQHHLCLDISITGLREARKHLGDRGAYVLGDLAALPFKDQSFGGVLASHCLYHVDKDLQPTVLKEMYRVTKPARHLLVFYSSRYNLISVLHRIPRVLVPLANLALHRVGLHVTEVAPYLKRLKRSGTANGKTIPSLYSYAHNPKHLTRDFQTVDVTCLMTLTRFDTELLRKLHLLRLVAPLLDTLEKLFPHIMTYIGKYVCIRIKKGA